VLPHSSVELTFKKTVESLFLSVADMLAQSFDGSPAPSIISDLKILLSLTLDQEILDPLVVDL
jgi:hypothetical protein